MFFGHPEYLHFSSVVFQTSISILNFCLCFRKVNLIIHFCKKSHEHFDRPGATDKLFHPVIQDVGLKIDWSAVPYPVGVVRLGVSHSPKSIPYWPGGGGGGGHKVPQKRE